MSQTLYTPESENLQEIPWSEYPRPQLKRDSYFCLNGQWELEFSKSMPENFTEKILVPFPPESLLSGVSRTLKKGEKLYYKKTFSLPEKFIKDKVFLHFGAVDNKAKVYINGNFVGAHTGGYSHFSFDITSYLEKENILLVEATDDLDITYPYGKQSKKSHGMWYTKVSGIWQTVWIESVPENFIREISVQTENSEAVITVLGVKSGVVTFEDKTVLLENGVARYTPKSLELWSPENPKLYYFSVEAEGDKIESYLAFRSLTIENVNGYKRLMLNGKPYYFNGVLDQGYFSDGLFLPASEKGYERDILLMKEAGFNMLRKHIKVEPEAFYYACDRLGMAVFQDMVNNGKYSFLRDTALPTLFLKRLNDRFLHINKKSREAFIASMQETVHMLKNHPSIVEWTIFNEGWGQFESSKMYGILKSLDSTRFIDSASGWFKGGTNDFESLHIYFKKLKIKKSKNPVFISEFGGYAFKESGHVFNDNKEYGYKSFKNKTDFFNAVNSLFEYELLPLVKEGLCASVYTQLSDVEDEINGLLTYDRRVKKFNDKLKHINIKFYDEIKK